MMRLHRFAMRCPAAGLEFLICLPPSLQPVGGGGSVGSSGAPLSGVGKSPGAVEVFVAVGSGSGSVVGGSGVFVVAGSGSGVAVGGSGELVAVGDS
jgi:hypothetical protein